MDYVLLLFLVLVYLNLVLIMLGYLDLQMLKDVLMLTLLNVKTHLQDIELYYVMC